VKLRNNASEKISGVLTGKYGDIRFEENVSIGPSEVRMVRLNPSTHPALHFANRSYGGPKVTVSLPCMMSEISFKDDNGVVSDKVAFKSGVREMYYTEDNIDAENVHQRKAIDRAWRQLGFP